MKYLREIPDLKNKKVLLRADLDVPVAEGKIVEKFRIEKQKETLDYLLQNGAKIVLAGHISAIDSFSSLTKQLGVILGHEIEFLKDLKEVQRFLQSEGMRVGLLENVRKFDGEKENNPVLAKELAFGFDCYVNNAFAVCHRNQASVSAITDFLPSYAGFQLEKEIQMLTKALVPAEGKVVVMGGAKAETKVPVIKNFLSKADKIIIGGVIANDYLKAKGFEVGESKVDPDPVKLLDGVNLSDPKILSPKDFNISDKKILDIGPKSIEEFSAAIKSSKVVIWNGPMGFFEDDKFSEGTKKIAEAVASMPGSIVGGGDTVSAIDKYGMIDKFGFISTGGGAMLEFLAGNALPGISALQK